MVNNKKETITKDLFVGIALTNSGTNETGIALLNKNLEILRLDKVLSVDDLKEYVLNISGIKDAIICVDLPKYNEHIEGKWRLSIKHTHALQLKDPNLKKTDWTNRYSDRGSDFCKYLKENDFNIYRYNCIYTKNILMLDSPFKPRSPIDCKTLQQNLKEKLKISGITSNLIAISGLNALLGAYTAWSTLKDNGHKQIGEYKELPIISAV